MAAIVRKSLQSPISIAFVLATGDDLDGTTDNTQAANITGAIRYIVIQDGLSTTLGTAGIDIIEISHDGGTTWAPDDTLILISGNDVTGTVVAATGLNAAGVEATTYATSIWKGGPQYGPTAIRCARKTTTTAGTTWVTGAPLVSVIAIGGAHSGGALTAIA